MRAINCFTGESSLRAVYKQLKMVEKEIQFLIDQVELFDLFPIVRPQNYVDPVTGEPDDTWIYPCKVRFITFSDYTYGVVGLFQC